MPVFVSSKMYDPFQADRNRLKQREILIFDFDRPTVALFSPFPHFWIHMPNESIVSIPKKTQIFVCHGKPCSKKKHRLQKLMSLFPMAKKTKCMGVCKGPVVLVVKNKERFYCKQIRKKKHRTMLWDFVVLGHRDSKLKYKRKRKKWVLKDLFFLCTFYFIFFDCDCGNGLAAPELCRPKYRDTLFPDFCIVFLLSWWV